MTLAAAVASGFFAGGAMLSWWAWQRTWHPPLRVAFEERARAARAEGTAGGRPLTEGDIVSVELTGELTGDAVPTETGVSLQVDVRSIAAPDLSPDGGGAGGGAPASLAVTGGVALTVVGEMARGRVDDWRAGRTVRAPAALRRPSRYLDPGVPDEEQVLARRGTTLVGTVKSGALVDVVAGGSAGAEAAGAVRAFARRAITASVGPWSAQAAAIVAAIVIGDRGGLGPDVQRLLQEAGTYHVIAISGGNIAILAGLALGAFRLAGMLGRTAMLCAIAGLSAYGFLVGGGASVDRATLMAVVVFGGRVIDLRGPPLNTLALVAAVLVVASPLAVGDPAFLLTCGATAAILVVVPAVQIGAWPRVVRPAVSMLAASLAAEAALFPVSAAIFSRVTVAGLFLNFAAIPLMAVAQVAGMAVVPLFAVSRLAAKGAGWVAFLGAAGLVRSGDLVRVAPSLTWRVSPPGWAAVACYYGGAAGAWALWRAGSSVRTAGLSRLPVRWTRHACAGVALAAAIWIVAEPWRILTAVGDGRLHATFIDVGQGDAALIRFPHGAALVVDAGGLSAQSAFDIGDRVVAPVLRQYGVRRLQVLALTHGDNDHIGGAPSLVSEFMPRDVWEGIPVPQYEPLRHLRAEASLLGLRWTRVQRADVTTIDDVEIVVRHPGQPEWERQKVRNDDSIVLELVWRDVSVVLTGDIGREAEQAIAPQFEPSRLRIVKVPHHGSLTSSSESFVRALSPRVAVVSVGRNNVFGHPAPAVLERYRLIGAEIFRTDQDGAVTVDTDGHSLEVSGFTGRRQVLR